MAETKQETVKDLKDLGNATEGKVVEKETAKEASSEAATPAEPKIDDLGRAYATGRRKESVARVWITKGSGKSNRERPATG